MYVCVYGHLHLSRVLNVRQVQVITRFTVSWLFGNNRIKLMSAFQKFFWMISDSKIFVLKKKNFTNKIPIFLKSDVKGPCVS